MNQQELIRLITRANGQSNPVGRPKGKLDSRKRKSRRKAKPKNYPDLFAENKDGDDNTH